MALRFVFQLTEEMSKPLWSTGKWGPWWKIGVLSQAQAIKLVLVLLSQIWQWFCKRLHRKKKMPLWLMEAFEWSSGGLVLTLSRSPGPLLVTPWPATKLGILGMCYTWRPGLQGIPSACDQWNVNWKVKMVKYLWWSSLQLSFLESSTDDHERQSEVKSVWIRPI